MTRIPLVPVEELSVAARAVYEAAGKLDVVRLIANSEPIIVAQPPLGRAVMVETAIAEIDRELIILAVSHLMRGHYEWVQHSAIARHVGMRQDWIDAIGANDFAAPVFGERERAILAYVRQAILSVQVDEYVFAAISQVFDRRQLVETVYIMGQYTTLVRLTELAQLAPGAPPEGGVLGWAKRGSEQ